MNIAIDIRHLASPSLSGVGYYTLNLISELARLSPDDTFFLLATGSKKARKFVPSFPQKNIRVIQKNIRNKAFSSLLIAGRTLESFLPEKPDLWLFPNLNIIRTKIPYLITIHDVSFTIFPEFFTWKQRLWHRAVGVKKLLENARSVLAVSESTKLYLQNLYQIPEQKITVTPLGVDAHFGTDTQPSDQNFLRTYKIARPYFLTLSTLEPRKNIASVIDAYHAWRETTSMPNPPDLVIAGGTGWKSQFTSQKNIHVIGYVNHNHKPALYRHATALFFPSFYEGFGLPPLESMACGTPVVTTFTGSLPEVVGDAALFVDPYNVRDLEHAFCHLEDKTLRDELSRRGKDRSQLFTWQKTAETTRKVIHTQPT